MAPRKQRADSPEFPILDANGLYAGEIRGDGNCLFNALSDQLYGHQEMHEVLRTATIEHMRENSDFYRQYMAVNNVRRNPKRKTTAALPTRIDTTYHTEEELQKQFEEHVEKMGQPGEWADNMEVSAFASALNVHVRLWQADYTYLFSPRIYYLPDGPDDVDDRQVLHIAYHNWEHYSSVRNIAGPHTGLPEVTVIPQRTSLKKRPSPSIDGDSDDAIPRASKRRSPLPLFDSDSTPEGTESSSDESNDPIPSQSHLDIPDSEQPLKPQKLTIKLRGLRTTDPTEPRTAIPPSTAPTSTSASSLQPSSTPPSPTHASTAASTTTTATTLETKT
ncbi:OTU-domain-containing protein [Trematosphaeria pertusa]|uniref:OTU-domain-containing protein n=1 Tax=Trematosphaeria pertusa TaxID=390896 RepID=A0A6A6IFD6_9PLEO|nr:OTU-domain-containing protein [Trematosphaeria pertusa]KAF2248788.1 OTU-domain-containing protein [Trematosphaeria pertusa]